MKPHPHFLPVSALSIQEGWTKEDSQRMHAHAQVAPDFENSGGDYKAEAAWREKHIEMMDALAMAIGRHVLHVAQTRGLDLPPHAEAVDNSFMNAWRKAASGSSITGREAMAIGRAVMKPVDISLVRIKPKFASEDCPAPTVEQLHEFIVNCVVAGNYEMFETEIHQCNRSGIHLSLNIEDWKPSLKKFDHNSRKFSPLKEGDITGPRLHHELISVPTGDLLIADWFRIDEFNQITEEVLKDTASINSAQGCEERSRVMARELGIANVFVGNTCPAVQADETGVRVGWLSEDKEMEVSEHVCTDLWWTTIVDKQVLVDLLSRKMPAADAARKIDDMIATQASSIIQVSVPPGQYHLYYTGEYEDFPKVFDLEGMDVSDFENPMFVLSRTQLQPRVVSAATKPPPSM